MKKLGTILIKNEIYQERNIKQKKASTCFFPRPLIFKLQQEVLKSNDTAWVRACQILAWRWIFQTWKLEVYRAPFFFKRNYLSNYLAFLYLPPYLFLSWKHRLKEHRYKFKIDNRTYSKSKRRKKHYFINEDCSERLRVL